MTSGFHPVTVSRRAMLVISITSCIVHGCIRPIVQINPVLEDHVDISSFDPTALIMRWIYVDEGDSAAGGRLAIFASIQIREAGFRAGVATTEGSS